MGFSIRIGLPREGISPYGWLMGDIDLVRVYDARPGDAQHQAVSDACTGQSEPSVFLVDRVWPRGVAKADLPHDLWLKDAGPSTELRKWFGHDPERFEEFAARYQRELDESPKAVQPLLEAAKKRGVLLLFSAKDETHNQAVVLRRWINKLR